MTFLTKKRSTKGFTLIELLVVIAIIGVLASIVLASLNTARKKSRDTRRVADMNQATLALQLYYDSNRNYPADAGSLIGGTNNPNPSGCSANTCLVPTFIATWPADPVTAKSYDYVGLVSDGGALSTATNPGQFFHIGATVEDKGITALSSRAHRCNPAIGNCTLLANTRVNGSDDIRCELGANVSGACYDKTP